MSNPFSTDSLAPNFAKAFAILKGDVAGHEFHGNQYVSSSNQAQEAQKLHDYVKGAGEKVNHLLAANQHQNIARALESASKSLDGEKGVKRLKNAFDKAAEAHRTAASAHTTDLLSGNNADSAQKTQKAYEASLKADEINYA